MPGLMCQCHPCMNRKRGQTVGEAEWSGARRASEIVFPRAQWFRSSVCHREQCAEPRVESRDKSEAPRGLRPGAMGAVNAAFSNLSDKGVLERLRKLSSGTVNAYGG